MVEMTRYEHGVFNWVDLAAKDMDAAARWYGELLGWTPAPQDTQGGPPYSMLMLRGRAVAGLGQLSEEMLAAGVPPMWNTYVAVDDAAAVVAKVTELGGSVMMPPMEIMDAGTMAVLSDPQGAAFCIWQAGTHIGCGRVNEPGAFSWSELMTTDLDAAQRFYGAAFGWTFRASGGGDGAPPYILIDHGDREIGGMLKMEGERYQGIPPHFSVYFTVEDVAAKVAEVEATGGTVHVPPIQIPVGTFSVVADPQGAVFVLYQSA